uniref:SFRICE_032398 n=1 Tax=Spodoptera frugiperda TaxID=7108 RepID=A0A2H1WUN1_SPOFR
MDHVMQPVTKIEQRTKSPTVQAVFTRIGRKIFRCALFHRSSLAQSRGSFRKIQAFMLEKGKPIDYDNDWCFKNF